MKPVITLNKKELKNLLLCLKLSPQKQKDMKLPTDYTKLNPYERQKVRKQYVKEQNNMCMFCNCSLSEPPPKQITDNKINWILFPPNFLKYPVHLQHNHETGMTEGAVHAYCNAVMWQYEGR